VGHPAVLLIRPEEGLLDFFVVWNPPERCRAEGLVIKSVANSGIDLRLSQIVAPLFRDLRSSLSRLLDEFVFAKSLFRHIVFSFSQSISAYALFA